MDKQLEELLIHRKPMLLLDRVISSSLKTAEAEVEIGPGATFMDPRRGVPAWIGIEYMAQTVGLIAGEHAKTEGNGAPVGYLLGTRRLDSEVDFFPPGARLRITAKELFVDDNGLASYECAIFTEDNKVMGCRLTRFRRSAEEVGN